MSTFTIADAFDATEPRLHVNMAAPLPLGYVEAVRRALELRGKSPAWSYAVIADVMVEYHGFDRSAGWWNAELRVAGAAARPLGKPFGAL